MIRYIIAVIALAVATPATAQEWLVNREQFRYIGTRLTIDVEMEAPGRLLLTRGQPGIVRVAGRTLRGFAASGLSQRGQLTLTALGGGPVDYIISVPEGVWVTVRLPDRHDLVSVGGHTRTRTLDWGATVQQSYDDPMAIMIAPPADETAAETAPEALFTTYTAPVAPRTVRVPDLGAIRTLTVRSGEAEFRVAASRPLTLQPGSTQVVEIRPAGDPLDLVIELPAGTADFTLFAGDAEALTVRAGAIATRCSPLTQQWLPGERQWLTFTPVQGRLDCGPEADLRHKG